MTGPEHYREAEAMLTLAGCDTAANAYTAQPYQRRALALAAAQVHATLAQAAAAAASQLELADTVPASVINVEWANAIAPRPRSRS